MRLRRLIAVVVVALLAASAAVAIAAAATFDGGSDGPRAAAPAPRASSPRASSPTNRAHRRAAQSDAATLVTKLNLPPGATRVGSEPAHDHGYLHPLPKLESPLATATAHAWWTVHGDPRSVIAAIEADPPAGATQTGTGSGADSKTGTSELEVDYSWPPVTGVLRSRLLQVTVTSIGDGRTGVLAEAQSVWIVPRSASERIPATTQIVQITSTVPGAARGGNLTVTRAARVRAIVALLNALPTVQPGAIPCPAFPDPKLITMTFRTRSAGPALAVLRFFDYRPWRAAGSGQCDPVQLSIGGRPRTALDGGTFIHQIERIIGQSIT
jgi:hypothetical protein